MDLFESLHDHHSGGRNETEALVAVLKRRKLLRSGEPCYAFEKKTTSMLVFSGDHKEDGSIDEEAIALRGSSAVKKTFNTRDSKYMNALMLVTHLQERGDGKTIYGCMGYYIILTYYASRNPVPHPRKRGQTLSVLAAFHLAGFEYSAGDINNPSIDELKVRLKKALNMLQIPNADYIADGWCNHNGFYDMMNDWNYGYVKDGCKGVFAQLGEILCRGNEDFRMQLQWCVDFALGCRDELKGMSNEQLYEHAKFMLQNEEQREARVHAGNKLRLSELVTVAVSKLKSLTKFMPAVFGPKRAITDGDPNTAIAAHRFKPDDVPGASENVACLMPEPLLRYMKARNITLNCTYDPTIAKLFHINGNLSSLTQDPEKLKALRSSRAIFESKVDYLMVSAGLPRLKEAPPFTIPQKNIRMASSASHELFHAICFDMNEHPKFHVVFKKMVMAAKALSQKMLNGEYNRFDLSFAPLSMDGTSTEIVTLRDILNLNTPFYKNYDVSLDKKAEEVMAHLFELFAVEMNGDERLLNCPIPEVRVLMRHFKETLHFCDIASEHEEPRHRGETGYFSGFLRARQQAPVR